MTIQELKIKHEKLKDLDTNGLSNRSPYKIFGSSDHQYKFNPSLTLESVKIFEDTFLISLPTDYKEFLIEIGDGGSGPAYGLFPLAGWNAGLEINENNFLSTPFPHSDKWDIDPEINSEIENYSEEYKKWEDEYCSNKYITGSLRICHHGCGTVSLIVVTGTSAGQIWIDDRANDNGIFPDISKSTGERHSFVTWYNEWLSESLNELM